MNYETKMHTILNIEMPNNLFASILDINYINELKFL